MIIYVKDKLMTIFFICDNNVLSITCLIVMLFCYQHLTFLKLIDLTNSSR